MKRKVTMQQIADYLGVSKYVVSKALSGKGGVSPATQEKVFKVATQLGYVSPKNKQVSQKSENLPLGEDQNKKAVLLLMPNVRFQSQDSNYWGKIVDSITNALKNSGFDLVIMTENSAENFSSYINPNAFLGVIGVGFIPTAILLEINRYDIPIVLVDHEDPLVPTDTIFVNNYDSSFALTTLLLEIGHKHISFIGKNEWSRSFYDRWLGFKTAMENAELFIGKDNHFFEFSGSDEEVTIKEVHAWLKVKKDHNQLPTAIVCANDSIAKCTILAIKKLGLQVPHDISITGFDNTEDSYLTTPTITTVNVQKNEMGSRSVEMLIRRIKKKNTSYEKVILISSIIYRDSILELKKRNK
ncbi:LacI family DNA-binding transcriptional regulator [Bacillus sp. IITD106]|nr:LacI family DNA-binding transcriptional regulator [Bacillus sp. IITD106]